MKRALVVFALLSLAACKDKGKESAAKASQDVVVLAEQADKDVGEVSRGLPEGAKKLAALWAGGADPRGDAQGVRKQLIEVRRQVPDLNVAKSTFFALADDKGVAIRNDLDEDVMAGMNLGQLFPDLMKAQNDYVEFQGAFPGPPGKNGPDKDWIAATPVKNDGKTVGIYLTGWTYRLFARHLQEVLKSKMSESLRASGDTGKMPIFYVGVFDKSGVYTAPLTPQVNEKALADENLVDKTTASGAAQGTINITDRDFGYAAKRVAKLGPDVGVVVLRSEL